MSDTTSTPTAPAAPAPAPETHAPAATQPAISISEAARMLRQQRRADAPATEAPAAPAVKPSANEQRAAAQKSPESPQTAPAVPAADAPSPLSALEKALGVPGTQPPQESTPAMGDGYEIEGRRYTPAELREAVLKSADYTKKSQENADANRQLSQQRQALQAQQEALAAVLPYIQPELQKLAQSVANPAQRPDPALLETNPQQYLRERAIYEQQVEEQNRLASLTTLQGQAQARAMEQQVAAANEQLAKEFPFWADPGERLKTQQQIVEWATDKGGFNRDELRGLTNPHHLKTMMKAMLFDRWLEGAKTSAPVSIAPVRGSAPPPAPTERVAVAQQAFEVKPSFRTGAALLAARRANGHAG